MSSYRSRRTGGKKRIRYGAQGCRERDTEGEREREVPRSRNVLPLTKNNAHKSFVLVKTTLSREFTRRQVHGRRQVTRRNKSSARVSRAQEQVKEREKNDPLFTNRKRPQLLWTRDEWEKEREGATREKKEAGRKEKERERLMILARECPKYTLLLPEINIRLPLSSKFGK